MTAAVVGQVGNLAGPRGGDARLDRSVRLFAGPDAIKKVLHVVDRAVAKAFGLHDGILSSGHAFVIDAEAAPVDL